MIETTGHEYVNKLTKRFPTIKSVWLIGSRANDTANECSDWDFIVFADNNVLEGIRKDEELH